MAGAASSNRQRSKIAPYLMIAPALMYLAVFFVVKRLVHDWPLVQPEL